MRELIEELVSHLRESERMNTKLCDGCAPGSTEWLWFDGQAKEAARLHDLLATPE